MIRACALILTLSLTSGAAAPVLCQLDCLAHTTHDQPQHCHDTAPGPTWSATSAVCDHALVDVDASVAAVKSTASEQLLGTPAVVTLTFSLLLQPADHASGPPDRIVPLRSVSTTILRI